MTTLVGGFLLEAALRTSEAHLRSAPVGLDQYIPSLDELLRLSPTKLQRLGLACMSLVCSTGLPGAEDVDIRAYLARAKEWAAVVARRIPTFIGRFRSNPAEYCNSEAVFLMTVLVQVLKKELGVRYNPDRISASESNESPGNCDSRDLLIHGPLGPTLSGTCNNIPMAIVAVARELGFPVYLAATAVHVYAKWHEPNGYTFNIEAANPAGMVIHPDEYYRDLPPGMTEALLRSGYYLRPLTVTDELALCMISRGWVLEAHGRYDEASLAHAHACRLAPIEPMYPRIAARCVGLWLRESFNARVSEDHRIRCKGQYQLQDLYLDPQRLLPQEHLPLALTILAAITKFRENSVRLLRSMRLRVACIARIVSASPVAKTNAHGSAINQSSSNANM